MSINHLNSIEETKEFLEINFDNNQKINELFTEMVIECRSTEACAKLEINLLHESGAQCLDDPRVYQSYAKATQKVEMEKLCSNLDFSKIEHEQPQPLPSEYQKESFIYSPEDIVYAITKSLPNQECHFNTETSTFECD